MKRKKRSVVKTLVSVLLIIVQLVTLVLLSYAVILYKDVETFYRYFGILIFIYFFFFLSYLLLRSTKRGFVAFFIPMILSLIISGASFTGYYYLTKVYNTIDDYSKSENMYHSSIVTYNKNLKSKSDLVDLKIGVITDEEDIEGCVLPNDIIKDLKLDETNKIVKYDSTMSLLNALKEKEVDAAFFSRNYVEMFSSMEEYENIETETIAVYTESRQYESTEEDIKDTTATLNKPFSILLIGVDSAKDGVTSGYNADVLLLATFNPKTLRVTLTSIPRDMYMKTACSHDRYRRINTTTWGSSSTCAVQTVEKLFNVNINYYAKINFKGVVKLVDAVGGIDVNVDYSICDQSSSRSWGRSTVYVEAGKQHLNGEQALTLARNRHKANDGSGVGKHMAKYCPTWTQGNRNDYTRGKNQMKVILGIVSAATKIKDPNKIISVLDTIKSNFQTNVKTKDLLSLYNLAKTMVVSDSTNLVNVQRMQLSGYSLRVYDITSKSYPSVVVPYNGSINDIKSAIKANLNNTKLTPVYKISFDLNNLYKDSIIGQGSYSQGKIPTLANVSSYSVDSLKTYANNNNLTLKFIDKETNTEVQLYDYSQYSFVSQKEHKDTIIDQISTLTIYVKKKVVEETP